MNKRLELFILIALTVAFFTAIAAFAVGYFDRSLGYTDVILLMIATMTYLAGCELAFYLTEKKPKRACEFCGHPDAGPGPCLCGSDEVPDV